MIDQKALDAVSAAIGKYFDECYPELGPQPLECSKVAIEAYEAARASVVMPQEVSEFVGGLEAILAAYPDPEMDHVEYRVFAARTAEMLLDRHKLNTGFLQPTKAPEQGVA